MLIRMFITVFAASLATAPAWAVPVTPVPEPESLAVFISGLLALIACRARKLLTAQVVGVMRRIVAGVRSLVSPTRTRFSGRHTMARG